MKIIKTTIPDHSLLNNSDIKYDFVDSFYGIITDKNRTISSTALGKTFFASGPKWVEELFAVRNKIVAKFGLKTSGNSSDRQQQLDNFKCEKGERLGLFKVFDKTDNEVVLGEDDKHLNFRVSLFLKDHKTDLEKREIIISTTVEFKNWFGPVYFIPVRPFHKIIVPAILKGIIKDLETKNLN